MSTRLASLPPCHFGESIVNKSRSRTYGRCYNELLTIGQGFCLIMYSFDLVAAAGRVCEIHLILSNSELQYYEVRVRSIVS